MHIQGSAIEDDCFCNETHGLSNVSHHLMRDTTLISSMMADEIILTADIFQSRRPALWRCVANLSPVYCIAGLITKRRLTDPRSVTEIHALF